VTTVEKISQHARNLPEIYQGEVLDFVKFLKKKTRGKTRNKSHTEDLQKLEDHGIQTDFQQSPSLEELAVSQGVDPISDVSEIVGTWPGTDDDGFEEDILALRKVHKKGIK
jgi:hypothetical protein